MSISIRHSLALAVALSGIGAAGGAATAGPAYKASDVVAHFSSKADSSKTDPSTADLGAARALCIGTESECAKQVPDRPRAVDGFDLRVKFDYNSANLAPEARGNLDEFVRALRDPRLTGTQFVVEGHTDGTGSDAFNLDLSMRRANSVVQYLEERGVEARRLEAKGFGKQKPLVSDPMSAENRRVETRLRID